MSTDDPTGFIESVRNDSEGLTTLFASVLKGGGEEDE